MMITDACVCNMMNCADVQAGHQFDCLRIEKIWERLTRHGRETGRK